jgi:hypothetical protein
MPATGDPPFTYPLGSREVAPPDPRTVPSAGPSSSATAVPVLTLFGNARAEIDRARALLTSQEPEPSSMAVAAASTTGPVESSLRDLLTTVTTMNTYSITTVHHSTAADATPVSIASLLRLVTTTDSGFDALVQEDRAMALSRKKIFPPPGADLLSPNFRSVPKRDDATLAAQVKAKQEARDRVGTAILGVSNPAAAATAKVVSIAPRNGLEPKTPVDSAGFFRVHELHGTVLPGETYTDGRTVVEVGVDRSVISTPEATSATGEHRRFQSAVPIVYANDAAAVAARKKLAARHQQCMDRLLEKFEVPADGLHITHSHDYKLVDYHSAVPEEEKTVTTASFFLVSSNHGAEQRYIVMVHSVVPEHRCAKDSTVNAGGQVGPLELSSTRSPLSDRQTKKKHRIEEKMYSWEIPGEYLDFYRAWHGFSGAVTTHPRDAALSFDHSPDREASTCKVMSFDIAAIADAQQFTTLFIDTTLLKHSGGSGSNHPSALHWAITHRWNRAYATVPLTVHYTVSYRACPRFVHKPTSNTAPTWCSYHLLHPRLEAASATQGIEQAIEGGEALGVIVHATPGQARSGVGTSGLESFNVAVGDDAHVVEMTFCCMEASSADRSKWNIDAPAFILRLEALSRKERRAVPIVRTIVPLLSAYEADRRAVHLPSRLVEEYEAWRRDFSLERSHGLDFLREFDFAAMQAYKSMKGNYSVGLYRDHHIINILILPTSLVHVPVPILEQARSISEAALISELSAPSMARPGSASSIPVTAASSSSDRLVRINTRSASQRGGSDQKEADEAGMNGVMHEIVPAVSESPPQPSPPEAAGHAIGQQQPQLGQVAVGHQPLQPLNQQALQQQIQQLAQQQLHQQTAAASQQPLYNFGAHPPPPPFGSGSVAPHALHYPGGSFPGGIARRSNDQLAQSANEASARAMENANRFQLAAGGGYFSSDTQPMQHAATGEAHLSSTHGLLRPVAASGHGHVRIPGPDAGQHRAHDALHRPAHRQAAASTSHHPVHHSILQSPSLEREGKYDSPGAAASGPIGSPPLMGDELNTQELKLLQAAVPNHLYLTNEEKRRVLVLAEEAVKPSIIFTATGTQLNAAITDLSKQATERANMASLPEPYRAQRELLLSVTAVYSDAGIDIDAVTREALRSRSVAPFEVALHSVLNREQATSSTRPSPLPLPGSEASRARAAMTIRGIDAAHHKGTGAHSSHKRDRNARDEADEAAELAGSLQQRGQTQYAQGLTRRGGGIMADASRLGYQYNSRTVDPRRDTQENRADETSLGHSLGSRDSHGNQREAADAEDAMADEAVNHGAAEEDFVSDNDDYAETNENGALRKARLNLEFAHTSLTKCAPGNRGAWQARIVEYERVLADLQRSQGQMAAKAKRQRTEQHAATSNAGAQKPPPGPGGSGGLTARFVAVPDFGNPLASSHIRLVRTSSDLDAMDTTDDSRAEPAALYVRMNQFGSTLQNGKAGLVPWAPGSAVRPREWISLFNSWCKLTNVPADKLIPNLIWGIGELNVQRELQAMVDDQPAGIDDQSFLLTLLDHFETHYSPSAQEERAERALFAEIRRGVGENIDDFLQRFNGAAQRAYHEQPWNVTVFETFLRALGENFQRHASAWAFVDPRSTSNDSSVNSSLQPMRSWTELQAAVRTWYQMRTPRDEHDDNEYLCRREKLHAEMKKNQPLGTGIVNADRDFQGTYSKSESQRGSIGRLDLYQTPKPRAETMKLFDKHTQSTAALARIVENGASKTPTHRPAAAAASASSGSSATAGTKRKSSYPASGPPKRSADQHHNARVAQQEGAGEHEEAGDTPKYGPCIECCLAHDWEFCPRNMGCERGKEEIANRYLGTGPHPKSTPEQREECVKKHGRIGINPLGVRTAQQGDVAGVPAKKKGKEKWDKKPIKTEGRQVRIAQVEDERYVRRITMGSSGQQSLTVPCTLNGIQVTDVIADTGAQTSLLSHTFYLAHIDTFGAMGPPPTYRIILANDEAVPAEGTLALTMCVWDAETQRYYTRVVNVCVFKDLPNVLLLGMPALREFFYGVAFANGHFTIRAELLPDAGQAPREATKGSKSALRVVRTESIPPGASKPVLVEYGQHLQTDPHLPIICVPCVLRDEEGKAAQLVFPPHVQSGATTTHKGQYWLTVCNISRQVIDLPATTIIGSAQAVYTPFKSISNREVIMDEDTENPNIYRLRVRERQTGGDSRALLVSTTGEGDIIVDCASATEVEHALAVARGDTEMKDVHECASAGRE